MKREIDGHTRALATRTRRAVPTHQLVSREVLLDRFQRRRVSLETQLRHQQLDRLRAIRLHTRYNVLEAPNAVVPRVPLDVGRHSRGSLCRSRAGHSKHSRDMSLFQSY